MRREGEILKRKGSERRQKWGTEGKTMDNARVEKRRVGKRKERDLNTDFNLGSRVPRLKCS